MMQIPFSPPDIGEEEIQEVVDTLRSGWITTGSKTKTFETQIAEFCNTKKAVCLNSATACMEMTLRLLGVGVGDEVITSAYTYTATASVICHVGATPILIDTGINSFEMDYDKMSEAISDKTKAIIPVDLAGIICDYDRIFQIVEEKRCMFHPKNNLQEVFGRIVVIADAAHSFGSQRGGKMSGNIADFTSFSFHAVKNLTTAEGGAVVWNDHVGLSHEKLYSEYMLMSLHGQTKDALAKTQLSAWEYDIVGPFYKCNMTDIMASIGLVQLRRYPDMLKRRRQIIEMYELGFKEEKILVLDHVKKDNISNGHLYLTRLIGKKRNDCNDIITKMASRGIATNVHYKPLPLFSAYKNMGFNIINYQNAYKLFENEITLPMNTILSDCQIEYIISSFISCINE